MADINLNINAEEIKKVTTELVKAAKAFEKAFKKAGGPIKKDIENLKKVAQATKKVVSEKKKLTAIEKEEARQLNRLNTLKAKNTLATSKNAREIIKQEKALRAVNAQLRSGGKNTASWSKALGSFQFKFNALGNIAANVTSRIAMGLNRAMREAVRIVKDFDKATARLSSILGKTSKEIEILIKQSKLLGATTQFTANQITGLQIELGKLGFTMSEIIASTPGVLSFATATGADLADAAKTAGAAVRVFGLNASETEDAVATLAVATTKSGLTFEHFDTILSTAGPVAKAYGFTLEDVIALTGELATAGFEANKAATATRNILLNLADANGALAKALGGSVDNFDDLIDGIITLDKKGISLAETLELTDKRSVAAFSKFLDGAESARELRDGISDVNDELQIMVDKQLDTLAGDIDLLRSAWEGFVLKADAGPLRAIVQVLTDAAIQVSNLDLAIRKFHKQTAEQLERSFIVLQSLTNKQGEQFQAVLAAFSDMTATQLEERKDDIINAFADIRKINQKEAEALFKELVRRRKEEFDLFIQSEIDKQSRLAEEQEKARKLKALADKKADDENLNNLAKQLAALRAKRNEASFSELEAIEKEIIAVQKKIDKYKEVGNQLQRQIDLIKELKREEGEGVKEEDQEAVTMDQDTFWVDLYKMQEDDHKAHLDRMAADISQAIEENLDDEDDANKKKKASLEDYINFADEKLNQFSDIFATAKAKELSMVGDNAEKREAIEKKYAKRERLMDMAQAIIYGAKSIQKTKAEYGFTPIGIAAMIADASITATQVGVIAGQKFAKGQIDIDGPSHARGGIAAEIEGGESVINKRSTSKYKSLLDAINEDDQVRIQDAMSRDRKITIAGGGDPYNRKIYELMKTQEQYGEDELYYYKRKGNTLHKVRKGMGTKF